MGNETVDGLHYQTGQPIRVQVSDGRIASITSLPDDAGTSLWIGPGLIDLQVNGFAGHDANAAGLQAGGIAALTAALWALGISFSPGKTWPRDGFASSRCRRNGMAHRPSFDGARLQVCGGDRPHRRDIAADR